MLCVYCAFQNTLFDFVGAAAFKDQQWGPNVEEFMKRFDPETSDGLGPQRLKNLYFTYLVELRALAKASPYFFKVGKYQLKYCHSPFLVELWSLVEGSPYFSKVSQCQVKYCHSPFLVELWSLVKGSHFFKFSLIAVSKSISI